MTGGDGGSSLKVELDLQLSGGKTLLARLQFRNDGEHPYRLLSWLTFPGGRVDSKAYLRVTLDGRPCEYIGMVKKRAPETENDYVTVAPGATLTSIVSLSDAYSIASPGLLTVVFSAINPSPVDDGPGDRLTSNPASIALR